MLGPDAPGQDDALGGGLLQRVVGATEWGPRDWASVGVLGASTFARFLL